MVKTVKIVCAIPSEGHTLPEALDTLLLLSMWLGKLETESAVLAGLKNTGDTNSAALFAWIGDNKLRKELDEKNVKFEFFWMTVGRMFTPYARDLLAMKALEFKMDYVFFMDDDMIIPQDTFYKLWKHNKEIVAALAYTRNPPHDPVLYTCKEGYQHGKEYFVTNAVRNYPKDTLVRVDAVGFGCVLIKTEVFRKMQPPWFMSTSPTGEDILFCINAGKAGVKVYSDTSIKIGHLSTPEIITEESFKKYFPAGKLKTEPAYVDRHKNEEAEKEAEFVKT